MEKSIENIWKEGFLKSDALVVPKINDLYNKKSIHIIDKFKRMFKINLIAIVVFSFVFSIVSYFVGIPLMGAIFFFALIVLVSINNKLLKSLDSVDKGNNSYEYLKSFNNWVKNMISINKRMSSIFYPVIFMAVVLGFWFKDAEGVYLGDRVISNILENFPETYMLFGLPLIGLALGLFIIALLAFFGGRIYEWDLKLVYGRVFKKLDELLADLENLNS